MPTPGLLTVISKPIKPDDPSSIEAFELECKEAHKTRREFLIIAKATVLSHEHYAEQDGKRVLDLYEIDDIDGLLAGKALLEEGGEGPVRYSHSSIYRHLSSQGAIASKEAGSNEKPGVLVIVSMEPPMTHLDEFNRWYEEEHIPLLSKTPGYISAQRGSLMITSDEKNQPPKFTAVYRYAAENGQGTSKEWKAATDTEWANKMRGICEREGRKERSVWEYVETH